MYVSISLTSCCCLDIVDQESARLDFVPKMQVYPNGPRDDCVGGPKLGKIVEAIPRYYLYVQGGSQVETR